MTTVAEHENRLKGMNRFNATGKRKVEESQKRAVIGWPRAEVK